MSRARKLDLRVFQQELATRLANKTVAQVESSRLGLAGAGGHWLIRLSDAAEVIAMPVVASVPLTKPWFLGVANIRGNLHTVVDFAGYLGDAPLAVRGAGTSNRLVLFGARCGELKVGIERTLFILVAVAIGFNVEYVKFPAHSLGDPDTAGYEQL